MKSLGKLKRYYGCRKCFFIWVTVSRHSSQKSEQCPECGSFNPKLMAHKSNKDNFV